MTTNAVMEAMLSKCFDIPLTRLQANGRMLHKAGLRASGGKGRGATHMNGKDVGAHALVLAMKLQTRDIEEIVGPVMRMSLRQGFWINTQQGMMWQLNAPLAGGSLSEALRSAGSGYKEFPTAGVFGDFLGQWIEGIFEPNLGQYQNGQATIVISDIGPRAEFTFLGKNDEVKLIFSDEDEPAAERPILEAKYILRDQLFQKLFEIIQDQETKPDTDEDA